MNSDAGIFRATLNQIGVSRESLLIVHSAFARLSRAGFQADAVIEGLLEHVRDGGLFMPTMTWRTVTEQRREWDELLTPSHTGILSEVFRTHYAVARSIHPTHSVAGYGQFAHTLLSRHHLDDTPVSANSPYGLMRDYDTFILLIGVGLESCTAIHLPEETIAEDVYVLPPETAKIYPCRDRTGNVHQVRARRHRHLDRNFPKFMTPLKSREHLLEGRIGCCPWMIVAMRHLLREVFNAVIDDPMATLAQ